MIPHRLNPISAWLAARRLWWATPFLAPGLALANPTGADVVSGDVSFATPDANTLLINQSTASAAINWQTFSIEAAEYVIFNQPSVSAVALNRVVGGSPSEIFGHLLANGRVFLINPQGILFAPGAQVDVGGLIASTMNISDEDFNAGRYVFAGHSEASVVNQGFITASDGGFVVLAADTVENSGLIQAQLGEVVLASGSAVTLTLADSGLISYAIDAAALSSQSGVTNLGQLMADGGRVVMAAATAQQLARTVVNNQGLVQARSIVEGENGEIILAAAGGDVLNAGTLDASATATSPDGGSVRITSDRGITLAAGSQILADGVEAGQGGNVRVIGEGDVLFAEGARISVRSGAQNPSGGGFVELSGHNNLRVRGSLQIGRGGTLLIDPSDLIISNGAGSSTSATVFEDFIESQLGSGVDVSLVATNSITLGNLADNVLDGGSAYGYGNGGDLLLGIGTMSGSYGSFFARGPGQPGGGIFFADANDTIGVDGNLQLIAGSQYGSISAGDLSAGGSFLEVTAAGSIVLDDVQLNASGDAGISILSGNGSVRTGGVTLTAAGSGNLSLSAYGDVTVNGDLTVSASSGPASLQVLAGNNGGYGDIAVYGDIGVSGQGGSGSGSSQQVIVAANVNLDANGFTSSYGAEYGGNVYVSGNISVTGNPITTSFSSSGSSSVGSGSTRSFSSSSYGTRDGDASLRIAADQDVDVGGITMNATGIGSLLVLGDAEILVRGATEVTVSPDLDTSFFSSSTTSISGAVVASQQSQTSSATGSADVRFIGGSCSFSFCSNPNTTVDLGNVSVTAPAAAVMIAGGRIILGSGPAGNDAVAVAGTGTSFFTSSNGSILGSSYGGGASLDIAATGFGTGTPAILSAGNLAVSALTQNANASLNVNATGDGDITVNGDLTVEDYGSAGATANINSQNSIRVAGDVLIQNFSNSAALSLAAQNDITVTGTTQVLGGLAGSGQASANFQATSGDVTTGNVIVSTPGNGNASLNVTAGGIANLGAVQVNSLIGNAILSVAAVGNITVNGATQVLAGSGASFASADFFSSSGAITTGAITVSASSGSAGLSLDADGDITVSGAVNVLSSGSSGFAFMSMTANSGDIRINGDLIQSGSSGSASFSAAGSITVNAGSVVQLSNASLTAPDAVSIRTSTGDITLNSVSIGGGTSGSSSLLPTTNLLLAAGGDLLLSSFTASGDTVALQAGLATADGNIALQNFTIDGGVVSLTATGNIGDSGSGGSINAGGLGVSAGQDINLANTPLNIGSGAAPFGSDPLLNTLLSINFPDGIPDSAAPNAAFSGQQVTLGPMNVVGDYLFFRSDALTLGPVTGPLDMLVHYVPFTPDATLELVATLPGSIEPGVTYLSQAVLDAFPGTTYVYGQFPGAFTSPVISGTIDGGTANFLFITVSQNTDLANLITSGTVLVINPVLDNIFPLPSEYEPGEGFFTEESDGESSEVQQETNSDASEECKT
ncbi:MAG: filamentous hemagglutinin N-terminal domain-containing protein [Nevskiales bacterium]|nr:filamentous hemagglutinin N-terminal domain-containing protein [Nevskiales bacterium]